MRHKALQVGQSMRLEHILEGLLIKLANHYTNRGVQSIAFYVDTKNPMFILREDRKKFIVQPKKMTIFCC